MVFRSTFFTTHVLAGYEGHTANRVLQ